MSRDTQLLALAEQYCDDRGYRLTEPRRQVLAILSQAVKPVGAYDIIALMPKGTQPPTVYRALKFWEAEGFVHCINSLNVYLACDAGHRHQGSQYMVCDDCGDVTEVHLCHLPTPLQNKVGETGFRLSRWNTEIHGSCGKCAQNS